MTPFRCWIPDEETDEDADVVQASSAESAAELYAERCLDSGDPFEAIDGAVVDDAGERTDWHVHVDHSPTFRAVRKEARRTP